MKEQLVPKGIPSFVVEYLKKHSADYRPIKTASHEKFNNIIVIPAIGEYENIRRLLDSLTLCDNKYFGDSFFLFVVNNTIEISDEIRNENNRAMELLGKIIKKESNGDSLIVKVLLANINIGLIDASSAGNELPQKDGGVGLARKTGMDQSLELFDYSSKNSKLLICLDADCTVAENYLTEIVETSTRERIKAGYVKFEHLLPVNHKEQLAIICYEIFLRYYVLGLIYSRSPYAFHTIGSTMICDVESYCKIGGMNKNKAAEDFYFMEKLAKLVPIHPINGTVVYPSSRGSWRVPFGTGQRVNRFLSETLDEYMLYNPKSFNVLKKWIELYHSTEIIDAEKYLKSAEDIHPALAQFLKSNSFEENWGKIISNSKKADQIQKQKKMWFDGFRTLKLIHFLRDNGLPQINMFDALEEMFGLLECQIDFEREKNIPSVETQIKYLNILKQYA